MQSPGNKIKELWYGPFVGDNGYRLGLPPYMRIYSVVNVENLKLCEASMLDQDPNQVLPSVKDLALEAQAEFIKGTILQNKSRTTK